MVLLLILAFGIQVVLSWIIINVYTFDSGFHFLDLYASLDVEDFQSALIGGDFTPFIFCM